MLKAIRYNSPVVLTFVIFSLAALGLDIITRGAANRYIFSIYNCSLGDPLLYIRIFCHVLGSADFDHFISNAMLILLVGPILEEKYGSLAILKMIIFTAFISGTVAFLTSSGATLGSSGIVFMMIILSSFVNYKKGTVPLTFILVVMLFLGKEVLALTANDQISQISHIIGGLCGGFFGLLKPSGRA